MDDPMYLRRTATTLGAAIALFVGAVAAADAQPMPSPSPTAPAPVMTPTAPAPVMTPAAPAPAMTAAPSPAASPAGQTSPAGTNNPAPPNQGGSRAAPPVAPFSHLPVIDFVVTFTQPAYYSNMSQLPHYDPADLGGTVRLPVTRKFSLLFDRITEGSINQPLERQLLPAPNFPKDTRDVILQYHGTYTFNRNFALDVGDSFRHRIFSSGTGKDFAFNTNISAQPYPYTLSSTEHHFGYASFIYTTRPWKEFYNSTFVFAETLDSQAVDHHVAILCTAAMVAEGINRCTTAGTVGYVDERPGTDRFWETTQGITWVLPLDAKHGTTFTANERWGYLNFYQNQPYPWRWASALALQLNKRFSPGFTLAMRHQDQHEALVGAPFAGNAANPIGGFVHVGSWDLIGTFHLDTNSLLH